MRPEVIYLILAGIALLLAAAVLKRRYADLTRVQWPTREPRPKLYDDGRLTTAQMLRLVMDSPQKQRAETTDTLIERGEL